MVPARGGRLLRRQGSVPLTTPEAALSAGQLRALPGEKVRASVSVELGTTAVDVAVSLINGRRPGPKVVITAGVHGGEFTGIGAATELAALLEPDLTRGRVVVCPVANPPAAFDGRTSASPLDGVNMNRVFPGDARGGPTERLAAWLFENLLDGADAYVDLHSGGIDEVLCDFVAYRLSGDAHLDARARELAHATGFEDVVVGLDAVGGNSHAAAARRGIPAILLEAGELGDREPAAIESVVGALLRLLRGLDALDSPEPLSVPTREWVWAGNVAAPVAGLWYPTFGAGQDVADGEPIGTIVDAIDGHETLLTAPASGRVFYGMRALTVARGTELAAIAARSG